MNLQSAARFENMRAEAPPSARVADRKPPSFFKKDPWRHNHRRPRAGGNEGVDLVTLAACDSSFGETTPDEGLMALADAFVATGAATVVAASFELDDASTTEFMQDFYELLLAGRSVEAALR